MKLPLSHPWHRAVLITLISGLLGPAVSFAGPLDRLTTTTVASKDYLDLPIVDCLKKLEKACNEAESDSDLIRIVIDRNVDNIGPVRDLFSRPLAESVTPYRLILWITKDGHLKQESKGTTVTIRPFTEEEVNQSKEHEALAKLLDGPVLERFHIIDTKSKPALAYLERAYAKRNPEQAPVRFRLSDEELDAACTLYLQNVPVAECVKYVSGLCYLSYRVDEEKRTVWFTPKPSDR